MKEQGLQVVDSLVALDGCGTVKVMLTNVLGITQKAATHTEIGVASPVELIDPCMPSAGVSDDESQFEVGCESACPNIRQMIVES